MALRLLFVLMMAGGYGVLTFALAPGLMSPDALFQYAQMKSGMISDIHPPIMIHLWKLIEPHIGGAAGLYLIEWAIYTVAVYLIASTLSPYFLIRVLIATLCVAPPAVAIMMTIWKDALMLSFLMLAVAAILKIALRPHLFWIAIALICLWMAAALRHNAIFAVLPLVGCIFYLIPHFACRWCLVARTMVLCALISLSTLYINRQHATHVSMLPTVAVWDLAAMSLIDHEMLIPSYALQDPQMTLAHLADLFDPISNVPLCRYTPDVGREVYCMEKVPLRAGEALPHNKVGELRIDWITAIITHPVAYFKHRMHVTCYLLDLCRAIETPSHYMGFAVSSSQPDMLKEDWYDGPDPASFKIKSFPSPNAMGRWIIEKLVWLRTHSVVMSSWPYMALLLGMSLVTLVYRHQGRRSAVSIALLASGWLMALPLVFIAPNFQLRYLIWPIMCAILSLCLFKLRKRGQKPEESDKEAMKKNPKKNLNRIRNSAA